MFNSLLPPEFEALDPRTSATPSTTPSLIIAMNPSRAAAESADYFAARRPRAAGQAGQAQNEFQQGDPQTSQQLRGPNEGPTSRRNPFGARRSDVQVLEQPRRVFQGPISRENPFSVRLPEVPGQNTSRPRPDQIAQKIRQRRPDLYGNLSPRRTDTPCVMKLADRIPQARVEGRSYSNAVPKYLRYAQSFYRLSLNLMRYGSNLQPCMSRHFSYIEAEPLSLVSIMDPEIQANTPSGSLKLAHHAGMHDRALQYNLVYLKHSIAMQVSERKARESESNLDLEKVSVLVAPAVYQRRQILTRLLQTRFDLYTGLEEQLMAKSQMLAAMEFRAEISLWLYKITAIADFFSELWSTVPNIKAEMASIIPGRRTGVPGPMFEFPQPVFLIREFGKDEECACVICASELYQAPALLEKTLKYSNAEVPPVSCRKCKQPFHFECLLTWLLRGPRNTVDYEETTPVLTRKCPHCRNDMPWRFVVDVLLVKAKFFETIAETAARQLN